MRRSRVCRLSLMGCPSEFSSGLNRPSACDARLSFGLLMCTSGAWYEERAVILHIPVYVSGMGLTFLNGKTSKKTIGYVALTAVVQNPGAICLSLVGLAVRDGGHKTGMTDFRKLVRVPIRPALSF